MQKASRVYHELSDLDYTLAAFDSDQTFIYADISGPVIPFPPLFSKRGVDLPQEKDGWTTKESITFSTNENFYEGDVDELRNFLGNLERLERSFTRVVEEFDDGLTFKPLLYKGFLTLRTSYKGASSSIFDEFTHQVPVRSLAGTTVSMKGDIKVAGLWMQRDKGRAGLVLFLDAGFCALTPPPPLPLERGKRVEAYEEKEEEKPKKKVQKRVRIKE